MTELIVNGGFESGRGTHFTAGYLPVGWDGGGGGPSGWNKATKSFSLPKWKDFSHVDVDTSEHHTGSCSALLYSHLNGALVEIHQNVAGSLGYVISFGFWYKNSAVSSSYARVELWSRYSTEPIYIDIPPASVWTYFDLLGYLIPRYGVYPTDLFLGIRFVVFGSTAETGVLYIDDVSLIQS